MHGFDDLELVVRDVRSVVETLDFFSGSAENAGFEARSSRGALGRVSNNVAAFSRSSTNDIIVNLLHGVSERYESSARGRLSTIVAARIFDSKRVVQSFAPKVSTKPIVNRRFRFPAFDSFERTYCSFFDAEGKLRS